MGRAVFFRFFAFFALAIVSASGAEASQRCAKIDDDGRRLECFDLEYRKTVKPVPQTSKWRVRRDISKIDDSENVFLFLESDNRQSSRFGQDKTGSISIACRENTTSIYILFGENFMADNAGGGRVTYRIDTAKARSKNFTESSDNMALGLWSGGSAIPFVTSLFGGSHLLIRAMPFNESALTYEYTIAGLEDAIKPLRAACNW